METTYAMIGSDGQQYGPLTLAQIKTWILEGRVGAETQVWRSDTNSWLPAGQYVELGLGHPAPPPPLPSGARAPGVIRAPASGNYDPMLERRALRSARWFYWIAALSLINTFVAASGRGVMFSVGLAVTQYYYFTAEMGSGGTGAAIVLSAVVAGVFAVLGYFACKRHAWSFIAGMVLYAGDALFALFAVPARLWLLVGFHVFILYILFLGLKATNELKAA